MISKKVPSRRRAAREEKGAAALVQLKRINLTLDLSSSGARDTLATLRRILTARRSTGPTQLRLDARDLNALYVYLPGRHVKSLVARLVALVELAPS